MVISCSHIQYEPKEYNPERSRHYNIKNDSIMKKVIEFATDSKIETDLVAVLPNIIIIEEEFGNNEAYKYTDYNPQKYNSSIMKCKEKLIISINSDSSQSALDIKSKITCNIIYSNYVGKSITSINKTIDCKSNGMREKELLDYIATK